MTARFPHSMLRHRSSSNRTARSHSSSDNKTPNSQKYRIFPPNWDMTQLQDLFDNSHTIYSTPNRTEKIFFRKQEDQSSFWHESNKRIKLKETYELYKAVQSRRSEYGDPLPERSDYFRKLMVYFERLIDHFKQTPPENKDEHTDSSMNEIPQNVSNNEEMNYLQKDKNNAKFCLYYKDAQLTVFCIPHITDAMQTVDDMCRPFEEESAGNTNMNILKNFNQEMIDLYASGLGGRADRERVESVAHREQESGRRSELIKLRDKRCRDLLLNQCSKPFRIITFVCYVYKSGDNMPMYSMRDLNPDQTESLIQFDKMYRKKLCELYKLDVELFQDYFNGLIQHPCHRDQCLTIHYEFQHPSSVYVKRPWVHFVSHPLRLTLARMKKDDKYCTYMHEVFVCKPIFKKYYLPVLREDPRYQLALKFFKKTESNKLEESRARMHLLLDCYRFYKLLNASEVEEVPKQEKLLKHQLHTVHELFVQFDEWQLMLQATMSEHMTNYWIKKIYDTIMQNDLETYKHNLINKYLISIHKPKPNDHPDFSFAELNVTDLIEANERDIENAKKINVNFEYWLDFDYWCNLIYAIDFELGCDAGIQMSNWTRGQNLPPLSKWPRGQNLPLDTIREEEASGGTRRRTSGGTRRRTSGGTRRRTTSRRTTSRRSSRRSSRRTSIDRYTRIHLNHGGQPRRSLTNETGNITEDILKELRGLTIVRVHRDFGVYRVILAVDKKDTTKKYLIKLNLRDKYQKWLDENVQFKTNFNNGFYQVSLSNILSVFTIEKKKATVEEAKKYGFNYLFGYVDNVTQDRRKYLALDEYSYYPMFMVAMWNGLHPIWYEANRANNNWDVCKKCVIADDRSIITLHANDVCLRTPHEVQKFVKNAISWNELSHSTRMLAWTIPRKYRKFFCRIQTGHMIPIIWMYSFTKLAESEWITQLIHDNDIFRLSQITSYPLNLDNVIEMYTVCNRLSSDMTATDKYPNANVPSTIKKTDEDELFTVQMTGGNKESYKNMYLQLNQMQYRFGYYTNGGCSIFSHNLMNGGDGSVPHVRISSVNTDLKNYQKQASNFFMTIRLMVSMNTTLLIELLNKSYLSKYIGFYWAAYDTVIE